VRLEVLHKLKKSTLSGTRTGDLPACSIVPQATMLQRAPDDKCSDNTEKEALGVILFFYSFLINIHYYH
jgi:hypothetical protein